MTLEEKIANDEAERSLELPDTPPHSFKGRQDQDCTICGKPDRNPIHKAR